MPLKSGSSQKVISENIRELYHSKKHRERKQIIAIAESMARRGKKRGK